MDLWVVNLQHSPNHFLNNVRRASLTLIKLCNIGKSNNIKLSNSIKGRFLQDNILSSNTSYCFKNLKTLSVCMQVYMFVDMHVCTCVLLVCNSICKEVRRKLTGISSVLPPYRTGDQTQVISPGSRHLYWLSHLIGSARTNSQMKTFILNLPIIIP